MMILPSSSVSLISLMSLKRSLTCSKKLTVLYTIAVLIGKVTRSIDNYHPSRKGWASWTDFMTWVRNLMEGGDIPNTKEVRYQDNTTPTHKQWLTISFHQHLGMGHYFQLAVSYHHMSRLDSHQHWSMFHSPIRCRPWEVGEYKNEKNGSINSPHKMNLFELPLPVDCCLKADILISHVSTTCPTTKNEKKCNTPEAHAGWPLTWAELFSALSII